MSLVAKQPVAGLAGADPPFVFRRWTKVVLDRILPPVGPSSVPIAVSSRQPIEPVFGQLGSVPAAIVVAGVALAHTLLLSKELCQVALPKATGCGALGSSSWLRKWVMIWNGSPKKVAKSETSVKAPLTGHETVSTLGRQRDPIKR